MKWKILESIPRFQGFFKLMEYQLQFERFDGAGKVEINREVFERGTAAAAIVYDPHADSLVLVEQFRSGAIQLQHPWLLELIAGIIEPNESASEVIKREAIEEAGCALSNVSQIAHYLVSPGGSTEALTIFAATTDSTEVADIGGLEEEGEDIKVHVIPRQEMMQRLEMGQIDNAMTLVGMQWLALNFERWRDNHFQWPINKCVDTTPKHS